MSEQAPRVMDVVAAKIGISGEEFASFMGPRFTATMRWLEGESHDLQDLVDAIAGNDEVAAHDVGDGFEMSAADCAAFVDEMIRAEQAKEGTAAWDPVGLRKLQEVSYHLHWHCANLDGK